MAKIPEAMARLFGNVFICKKCKQKQKAPVQKIMQKKITCKKCGGKSFRPAKRGK